MVRRRRHAACRGWRRRGRLGDRTPPARDKTIKDYWRLNGKLRVDLIIGKTGGQAKVLLLDFTDQV
jgi:hypothetical protein